jgi:hypothetical protein
MGVVIDFHEPGDTHVRVFLRGGEAAMPKELLDSAQIGPSIQHMGCEGVTNGMGMDRPEESRSACIRLYHARDAAGSKPVTPMV